LQAPDFSLLFMLDRNGYSSISLCSSSIYSGLIPSSMATFLLRQHCPTSHNLSTCCLRNFYRKLQIADSPDSEYHTTFRPMPPI